MENDYPDSVRIFPNNENPNSAIGHLDTLRWRLTDLLGLEWSSEKHRYVKTIGVKNGK